MTNRYQGAALSTQIIKGRAKLFTPSKIIRNAILLVIGCWLSANSLASCVSQCELKLVDAHPHEALQALAKSQGAVILVEGELLAPLTTEVRATSFDNLVRELADRGGYLIGKKGRQYTFYGTDLEEVTITLTPHHIPVADAAEQLIRFESVDVIVLESANALVVRGTSKDVRRASELLKVIDYARPNVFLELLVVEYFHGDSFTWSFDVVNAEKGNVSDLLIAPSTGALAGQYDVIADLDKSFRLNLSALAEDNEARIVTNPHVAVRSGEAGEINFKEELNIVLSNDTDNFGVTRTLETLESGISLEVTPRVFNSNYVELAVYGELGVFVPSAQGQFAIDRQTVKTGVLVESGQTLVIGGLVVKLETSTESGVPGLRRIPLLGNLFKGRSRREAYIETVIYITPYIDAPDFFLPKNIAKDVEAKFSEKRSSN